MKTKTEHNKQYRERNKESLRVQARIRYRKKHLGEARAHQDELNRELDKIEKEKHEKEQKRNEYLKAHRKEIDASIKNALKWVNSLNLSYNGYNRYLVPMFGAANKNPVQCPACGKFDNGWEKREGFCFDCWCKCLNLVLLAKRGN
jgi:hypothetical protein